MKIRLSAFPNALHMKMCTFWSLKFLLSVTHNTRNLRTHATRKMKAQKKEENINNNKTLRKARTHIYFIINLFIISPNKMWLEFSCCRNIHLIYAHIILCLHLSLLLLPHSTHSHTHVFLSLSFSLVLFSQKGKWNFKHTRACVNVHPLACLLACWMSSIALMHAAAMTSLNIPEF